MFADHLLVNTYDDPTFELLLTEFDLHVGCRVDAFFRRVYFVFEQLMWSSPAADLDLHVNQITRLKLMNEFLCYLAPVSQLVPLRTIRISSGSPDCCFLRLMFDSGSYARTERC